VIAAERASADAWVLAYQTFEDDLIRAGKDPDDEANLVPFTRPTAKRYRAPKTLADRMPTRAQERSSFVVVNVIGAYSYSRCGNPALEIHST